MIVNKEITPHKSLRNLFEKDINVNHISEDMKTFNSNDSINQAWEYMNKYDFDNVGVEEDGKIIGYIDYEDLEKERSNKCGEYRKDFIPGEVVSDTTPLINALYLFKGTSRIFVLEGNKVTKIVTKSDFQKTPVQLLLFGLVSMVEMYLLKLIKGNSTNRSWKGYLADNRIKKTEEIYNQRKQSNEEIELIDCLQLCDKRDIILKNEEILPLLPFGSKNKGDKYFKKLEGLRNDLAHVQDFMNNFALAELIILVEQTEDLLRKCEKLLAKANNTQ
ncbi:CBS domain-containing protein [Lentibacillus sediminis]|uniref:CBS domain-containing protein n=1 Tax=Lentibacillus sediminis TaxID=1940529 RepID=UPI000C1BCE67|nr:CBS domain-containing protein [Lentibacillus sediminis]